MSLKTWLKVMSFGTIMALIYIHMQMQIFDLAYQGKDREKHMHELRDVNGLLTHQILTFKSANHLGNQLLDKGRNLEFVSNDHIMTLKGPASMFSRNVIPSMKTRSESMFSSFLSFLTPQEAKAWEREQ